MVLRFLKYIIILFTLTIGCKKTPFDYRNKFCGTYDFIYTEVSWTTGGNNSSYSGTYTGKVYYGKRPNGDNIIVNFKEGMALTFPVDKNGKITGCGSTGQFVKKNQ